MHRMPLLVKALDLPALLDHVDDMDARDAYYEQALGNVWPEDENGEDFAIQFPDHGGFEPNESPE